MAWTSSLPRDPAAVVDGLFLLHSSQDWLQDSPMEQKRWSLFPLENQGQKDFLRTYPLAAGISVWMGWWVDWVHCTILFLSCSKSSVQVMLAGSPKGMDLGDNIPLRRMWQFRLFRTVVSDFLQTQAENSASVTLSCGKTSKAWTMKARKLFFN